MTAFTRIPRRVAPGRIAPLLAAFLLAMACPCARAADLPAALERIDALMTAGDFPAALEAAEAAVASAAAAGDLRAQATAELRVSDALYYLGRREETLAPMERALALYQQIGDLEGIGRSYYSLAYYYERSESAKMIELLEKGRLYAEQAGDSRLTMNIANAMGVALWSMGRYDEASASLEQSIAIAREAGNGPALASANQNLGLIHLHRGENLDALEHFSQALAELEKAGNTHGVAVVLGNMGNAYLSLRDLEAALDCYRRALQRHRQNGYLRGVAIQLNNLASLHEMLEEFAEAGPLRREAVEIATEVNDQRTLIGALTALGQLALAGSDPVGAEAFFSDALAHARTYGDPDLTARPLQNLAAMHFAAGDTAGGWAQLAEAEDQAAQVGDTYILGSLQGMRADQLAALGRPRAAAAAYQAAVDLHEGTRTRTHVFLWRARLARQRIELGEPDLADHEFQLSLQAIDDLDALIATGNFRIRLFAQVARIFQDYAVWLASRGRETEAWEILERGRGRDLAFRLLQDRGVSEFSAGEMAALAKLSAFQRRLREEILDDGERAELLAMITAAETEYDRTRWALGGTAPSPRRPPDLSLGRGQLAVLYSVFEDTLLVMSATGGGAQLRKVPEAAALMERCRLFSDLVFDPGSGDRHQAAGRSLFAALLGPEMERAAPARLVISPDKELWNLPFAALRTADGRYLGEAVPVSLVPTLGIAQELASRPPPAGRTILAVANSRFDDTAGGPHSLDPLPSALKEAEFVTGLGPDAVLLLDADEDRFKAADLRGVQLLHFATHTLVDPLHANRASIVLAAGGHQDGLLQAREIYRLPLDARLSVVSGCRSGDGGTVAGEGLLGLSHALLSAGSRCVVLSRRDIADEGAAFFMGRFHAALQSGSVEQALQSARLACLNSDRWSHPAWWAAFFVAGDGEQTLDLPGKKRAIPLPAVGGVCLGLAGLFFLGLRRR